MADLHVLLYDYLPRNACRGRIVPAPGGCVLLQSADGAVYTAPATTDRPLRDSNIADALAIRAGRAPLDLLAVFHNTVSGPEVRWSVDLRSWNQLTVEDWADLPRDVCAAELVRATMRFVGSHLTPQSVLMCKRVGSREPAAPIDPDACLADLADDHVSPDPRILRHGRFRLSVERSDHFVRQKLCVLVRDYRDFEGALHGVVAGPIARSVHVWAPLQTVPESTPPPPPPLHAVPEREPSPPPPPPPPSPKRSAEDMVPDPETVERERKRAAPDLATGLRELLQCPVCMEVRTGIVVPRCGHLVCADCHATVLARAEAYRCVVCRRLGDGEQGPLSRLLRALVQLYTRNTGSVAAADAPADSTFAAVLAAAGDAAPAGAFAVDDADTAASAAAAGDAAPAGAFAVDDADTAASAAAAGPTAADWAAAAALRGALDWGLREGAGAVANAAAAAANAAAAAANADAAVANAAADATTADADTDWVAAASDAQRVANAAAVIAAADAGEEHDDPDFWAWLRSSHAGAAAAAREDLSRAGFAAYVERHANARPSLDDHP